MVPHMIRFPAPFLLLACMVFVCLFGGTRLEQAVRHAQSNATGATNEKDLEARNTNAFATILGEARANASDFLFIKTTVYAHAGVAYQTKSTDAAGKQPAVGEGEWHDAGSPTLIRSAAADYRGFLGTLEREVKPYRDAKEGHVHVSAEELAPWIRVMTLSNPHFIRGYRLGASVLQNKGKWLEAETFLKEGIANNQNAPNLFQLYQSLTQVYAQSSFKKTPWTDNWKSLCLESARKAYDLALPYRSEHGEVGKKRNGLEWSDDLEEDFDYSAQMTVLMIDRLGKKQEAINYARQMLKEMPELSVVQRTMERFEKELLAGAKPVEDQPDKK
jgi:hypothetical protein